MKLTNLQGHMFPKTKVFADLKIHSPNFVQNIF